MARLIDADALKENCYKKMDELMESTSEHLPAEALSILCGFTLIDSAPTIDAVEVVHGEWIVKENHGTGWYRITCSECGEDVTSTAPCIGFMPIVEVLWDYCPYCGAKMDGEREGE